jgi:hypothetical protein
VSTKSLSTPRRPWGEFGFGYGDDRHEPTPGNVSVRVFCIAARLDCFLGSVAKGGPVERVPDTVAELRRLVLALDAWD